METTMLVRMWITCVSMAILSFEAGQTQQFKSPFKHGNKTYLISTEMKTWQDSRDLCKEEGAGLAKIEDKEKNTWLHKLAKDVTGTNEVCLAGNDRDNEGRWLWEDGTNMTWANWSPGQPNDYGGRQDCLTFYKFGSEESDEWNDVHCSWNRFFICEMFTVANKSSNISSTTSRQIKPTPTSAVPTSMPSHLKSTAHKEASTQGKKIDVSEPATTASAKTTPASEGNPSVSAPRLQNHEHQLSMCFVVREPDGYKLICR